MFQRTKSEDHSAALRHLQMYISIDMKNIHSEMHSNGGESLLTFGQNA